MALFYRIKVHHSTVKQMEFRLKLLGQILAELISFRFVAVFGVVWQDDLNVVDFTVLSTWRRTVRGVVTRCSRLPPDADNEAFIPVGVFTL